MGNRPRSDIFFGLRAVSKDEDESGWDLESRIYHIEQDEIRTVMHGCRDGEEELFLTLPEAHAGTDWNKARKYEMGPSLTGRINAQDRT